MLSDDQINVIRGERKKEILGRGWVTRVSDNEEDTRERENKKVVVGCREKNDE